MGIFKRSGDQDASSTNQSNNDNAAPSAVAVEEEVEAKSAVGDDGVDGGAAVAATVVVDGGDGSSNSPAYIDTDNAATNMMPDFNFGAGNGSARMNIVMTGAMKDRSHPTACENHDGSQGGDS